jgi:hypothetical protein
MQAQEKVGEVLHNFEEQMKAQEKAGVATTPKFGPSK